MKATQEEIQESLDAGGYGPSCRKPSKGRPEDLLHIACAKWLRAAIGREGIASSHGIIWFSYEMRNAGKEKVTKNGRVINLEGIARKQRGCVAGLPDINLVYRGGVYGIELKAGKGALSDSQRALHPELRKAGAQIAVARSVDDVEAALRGWELPLRVRA